MSILIDSNNIRQLRYFNAILQFQSLHVSEYLVDTCLFQITIDNPVLHRNLHWLPVEQNPLSNKAAQATSTATSTRPTPNEPLLCSSSNALPSCPSSKAPPSHPPSKVLISNHTFGEPQFSHVLDEQAGIGDQEQVGSRSGETDMRKGEDMHYLGNKLKVVGHTITHPSPEHQSSATNSMQTDRLKTSYSKSNECHNNRATGHQKQQGKNNATSHKSVTNAPWSTHNNSKDNDDNDDNDSSGNSKSLQVPHTCVKFIKNNLPPGLPHDFDALIVPMWIDFISTLDNIDFGERTKIVIAKYIEEQGWTSDEIQQVVAYIVPEEITLVNKKGQKNYYGAFEDQCILDTFVLYLEHVHCLPTTYCSGNMPKGTLSIATVTVEQTWNMWKTRHFVQPTKASQRQFAEGLWSYSTELIMESIDGATHCEWKKIFKGAAPFINAHRKQLTQRMQLQAKAWHKYVPSTTLSNLFVFKKGCDKHLMLLDIMVRDIPHAKFVFLSFAQPLFGDLFIEVRTSSCGHGRFTLSTVIHVSVASSFYLVNRFKAMH
ncbi:uncharacterized protein F5891DRAFT_984012 [Suillus fuscotomentosus]|uniref:Uncharacterized protein n=1 Tax=Suillus fuscotomentosus TaxID=1912939 RepID=A0AAD4HGH7_9AGAM|nr:uncharacterized protein F5891DRAFT_984012 [Suillus fuscotomentosus]KAG1895708.1 hypothetical protein F5891DRAFT_984012 [Suillus fuscotomentosus]